ncbi:FG-GAP repeat domain-containing protein [Pricia sp.]|uniref:FG-GAP repeat domain-containing protein n=1 Tax=Pricia sp. TaxID=2268138 RepID=UPI003593EB0D
MNSPAADIAFPIDSDPLLLNIGKLAPSDQKKGSLGRIGLGASVYNPINGFSDLKRPVSFEIEDLNSDGKNDVIICSFGHNTGKLAWYDNFDSSKEHILSSTPGARKVEIEDFNSDGKPDLVVMMAQALERISIYYNMGNGTFEERPVLEFSPVHGVSYFELADFNGDGHQDLLVTNGDNRDFSSTDKPYHGLRIYLNDGHNKFEETFFFLMYDCSKAMARDFDNDGDLDIVAAALYTGYTDRKKADKAIVFLENSGNFNFVPSFPTTDIHGNWLTMEVADFDKDGLLDVMLGAFLYDISEMVKISSATGLNSFPQVLLLTQAR